MKTDPGPGVRVSVILISHPKYRQYLNQALSSLRSQLTSFELIYLNNKSLTLASACNKAIGESQGRYIIRLDADDWIEPELIKSEADYLDENLAVDCVWCDYLKTREVKNTKEFKVHKLEHYPQKVLEHACGAMYRREVWEDLKYNESLSFQESYDFWMRFKKKYKAERIPIPMYYYRQHGENMSLNPERLKVREEIENR